MTNINNQSGRSMIEMLGVLVIIGVLSVGGIAGYSKAMLKYKTNKTIDQITMLTTNIRTLFAQQKEYTGIDNYSTLITLGVVPDEMYTTDSTELNNPFTGAVTVGISDTNATTSGRDRAFIIEVNDLPREACMSIATSDWGSNYSSGLIGIAVKGAEATSSLLPSIPGITDAYAEDEIPTTTPTTTPTTSTFARAGALLEEVYAGCNTEVTADAANGSAYCAARMPISVSDASTLCSSASDNSIAFKYY